MDFVLVRLDFFACCAKRLANNKTNLAFLLLVDFGWADTNFFEHQATHQLFLVYLNELTIHTILRLPCVR